MVRRKRRNRTLVVLLLVLAAGALGYVVGVPLVEAATAPPDRFAVPLSQQIHFRLFELLIFVWLFMFGASIGSFLNVVVYRTPLGFSLLGSSRCPYCRVGIFPRDNLPVFGWLMLRGRCRACRLPISRRYPLIEFTVGMLILILGTLEVLQAGVNLPPAYGDLGTATSISWLIHHPNWDVIVACVLHGMLICIVFSWALIEYDGHAVPRGYLILALAMILAIPLVRPTVQPIPWASDVPVGLQEPLWLSQRFSILVGLAVGLAVGAVLGGIERLVGQPPSRTSSRVWESAIALGLVGIALGWQATISVALIASVMALAAPRIVTRVLIRRGSAALFYTFMATALQIYLWGALERLAWWPNSQAGAVTIVVALVGVVLLSCLASLQAMLLTTRAQLVTSQGTEARLDKPPHAE